jgi:acetyl esterase/lipase
MWAALGLARDPGPDDRTASRSDPAIAARAATSDDRAERRPRPIVRFTVGEGSRGAAIVRRSGATGPQPVVIFLHGWGLTGSGAYRLWIRHLAALGNTVIVPRYQRDAQADPGLVRAWALAGIRQALRRVDVAPKTLVVAGHSAGAALAADYAAIARAASLPRPVGVFAVYPGRRILGYPAGIPEADPARIPGDTRLTVMAGTRDVVVGLEPARDLHRRAVRIPATRRRLVVVREQGAADHYAPTRSGPRARRVFWRRLDRLIDAARR